MEHDTYQSYKYVVIIALLTWLAKELDIIFIYASFPKSQLIKSTIYVVRLRSIVKHLSHKISIHTFQTPAKIEKLILSSECNSALNNFNE